MPDSSTNQESRHRLVEAYVATVAVFSGRSHGRRLRADKDGSRPARRRASTSRSSAACCSSAKRAHGGSASETAGKSPRDGRSPSASSCWVRHWSRSQRWPCARCFVDVRDHKSITKIVFNAAQITASLAAGAIVSSS